jgi:hypothetical protein
VAGCCGLMAVVAGGESATSEVLADPVELFKSALGDEAARASSARIRFSCLTNRDFRRRISSMSSSTTFVYISNDPKFIIEKKFPKKGKTTYGDSRSRWRRRCLRSGTIGTIRNSRLRSRRTSRWHFAQHVVLLLDLKIENKLNE